MLGLGGERDVAWREAWEVEGEGGVLGGSPARSGGGGAKGKERERERDKAKGKVRKRVSYA